MKTQKFRKTDWTRSEAGQDQNAHEKNAEYYSVNPRTETRFNIRHRDKHSLIPVLISDISPPCSSISPPMSQDFAIKELGFAIEKEVELD